MNEQEKMIEVHGLIHTTIAIRPDIACPLLCTLITTIAKQEKIDPVLLTETMLAETAKTVNEKHAKEHPEGTISV